MGSQLSRRDFVKTSVAAATATAVGVPMIETASAADLDPDIQWEKSVCRFCGVGCGLEVGTKNGQVAAVKGDPKNPVNRGLLCVKGYANANILYGVMTVNVEVSHTINININTTMTRKLFEHMVEESYSS